MHDPAGSALLPHPPRRPVFQSVLGGVVAAILFAASPEISGAALAQASAKKPNILVIMGDDVGWFNIGAYHRGIMSGKTPNLDKLADEGMMFTDYYAEASCTAGRANFITGELPIRTGLTTVGQAGAEIGIPDEAVTLATVLKSQGYTTGQFGKNHLGDLNKFLPTVHASMSSSATSTISTPCRTPIGTIIPRIGSIRPGRVIWCMLSRPT